MEKKSDNNIYELIVNSMFNESTPAEDFRLREWVGGSEANARYFAGLRNTCLATLPLRKVTPEVFRNMRFVPPVASEPVAAKPKPTSKPAGKNRLLRAASWSAAAAAVAVIGGISWLLLSKPNDAEVFLATNNIEFAVENGTTASTVLPDGSKIWLNAGSRISYSADYNDADRRTVLLEGEAYFDVATNPARPFVVKADRIEIVATGTSFNVSAYKTNQSIVTTLIHGEVTIQGKNITKPITLKPEHTVEYFITAESDSDDIVKTMDMSVATAYARNISLVEGAPAIQIEGNTDAQVCWMDNCWMVDDERLEKFIPRLERRYNVSFYCTSSDILNYRFTGSFKGETVEEVLKILRRTLPLKYKIERDAILLFAAKDKE